MPNTDPSASLRDRPSASLRDRPSAPLRDRPSAPLRDRPSAPLRDRPSAPLRDPDGAETETRAELSRGRIPYHNASFDAFLAVLSDYLQDDSVAPIDEFRLSKEPLRIDIVIIKNNRDIELKPVWAKIFRGHNLMEYKSPVDKPPTLAVFNKLIGYAYIYAAQKELEISDVTATLVCARTPKKLFKILKEKFGYEILEKYDGIYYIMQQGAAVEMNLALQVMVQKSEPLLQAMDKRPLDGATADKIAQIVFTAIKKHAVTLGYWSMALTQENLENILERMGKMTKHEKDRKQVLESFGLVDKKQLEEGHLKGRQEGLQEGLQEGMRKVISLLEKGYSLEDAKKMLKLA